MSELHKVIGIFSANLCFICQNKALSISPHFIGKPEHQQMYLSRISDMAFNAEDISIKISELGTLSTLNKIRVQTGFSTAA